MSSIKNESSVIALLGQPNSGKSTLFNGLTGARQHVGNWPGKTVEKKEGYYTHNGVKYTVADLPGTYSLSANSEEEVITRDYIACGNADVVCILADASQLQRSLFMLADYAGINRPVILLLNLMDVAKEQGKLINAKKIEEKLGIPVVPFTAADKKNYAPFYTAIDKAFTEKRVLNYEGLKHAYEETIGKIYQEIYDLMPREGLDEYSPMWLAAKVIEGDAPVIARVKNALDNNSKQMLDEVLNKVKGGSLLTGECKFTWIDGILQGAVTGKKQSPTLSGFDKIATSKKWGKLLAVVIILVGLIASFIPALPFMGIGAIFSWLADPIRDALTSVGAPAFLIGLVCDVLINCIYFVMSMIGFVFGVNLVFGLIEEVGYMARISYSFDNTMARLGLQGKAIMPFLVSFGCTMGGAASTRVIDSWGQRVLTIALAWALPCAATWSIVPVIAVAFFGGWAPLIVVIVFATSFLIMFIAAKVFGRKLVSEEERTGMIMELPPYHKPKWRNLLRSVFVRTKDILLRALRVILLVSVIFWLLTYSSDGIVDNSIIYKIGKTIEPVTQFFGLGWQTFMAFICSAISKEAALGVLSTLFTGAGTVFSSTIGGGSASNINEILVASISQAEALAFIFAVTFNVPCIVALAATYQETHSAKWTAAMAGFYIGTALVLSCIVYHIGILIF